jgi:GGDEF domain-containing protein
MRRDFVGEDVFIGHVGGDDFFAGISGRPVAAVRQVLERLLADFSREVRSLYSPEDQLAGEIRGRDRAGQETTFPMMRCSAVVLVLPEGEVIGEAGLISSRIAGLKADAKGSDGGLVLSLASANAGQGAALC